jgi:hypothetical protein
MLIIETQEGTGLVLDNNEALVKEMLGKFDRDGLVNIFECDPETHLTGKLLETIAIKDLFKY